MPKLATIQTNFSGGELSPNLLGRVDIAKYANGVARMENVHPVVQGGATSRSGTRYLGTAPGDGRLVPFVFARDVAYQIEITDLKIRIWRANGTLVIPPVPGKGKPPSLEKPTIPGFDPSTPGNTPVALELVTPYPLSTVMALEYEQAEDTMFFFHPNYAPRRLQRLSDAYWRLEVVPFVTPPFSEQGFLSSVALTLSDSSAGTGRTASAASPVFLAGDVGRGIDAGVGAALITGYTSATAVTVTVTSGFDSTSAAAWQMRDSPQAFIAARQKDPVGSTVLIDAALPRAAGIALSDTNGSITITADAAVFVPGDAGKTLYADSGVAVLAYTSATVLTGTTSANFLRKAYQTGSWGITGDAFRPADVGNYIRLNSGLFLVTGYNSATQIAAQIRVASSALVAAPPGAWSLSQPVFNATNGYPRCGALHEQRLYLAGNISNPQTAWASAIGEYLNFEPGLLDADGFEYTLNTNQRNAITHLVSGKRLFGLTAGSEVSMRGGNEKAMGPTNVQKDNESSFGCSQVRPVKVAKEVLFVDGSLRKIRALGYSAAIDGFDSPDRTVFADHITGTGIVDMAFQATRSLLFCVRADGQMAVGAYDVSQEVVAWSRYVTAGSYRSVSCVPNGSADDVWVIVNRPQNGTDRFMVERFERALSTDSAGTYSSATTTLGGLARFEGLLLSTKADGSNMGLLPVVGGAITLPRSALVLETGLPLTGTLELLPPEVGGGGGTAQGSNVSVHEVTVRLLDTADITINGTESDFRRFGSNLLDKPPPGLTGDYRAFKLTDDLYRDKLVISQSKPFRMQVQAVIRKITVNDV